MADASADHVHPYLEEIMKCPSNDWQLEKKDPVPFKLLEDTPYKLVDSKECLDEMMTKLRKENEIALGIRRYKYCSFNGINCLIQISTRSEIFLVDTITLKDEVKVLNEVLSSLSMLKVTGQIEGYVESLQKDLGLYIVNLFALATAWKTLQKRTTAWKTLQKRTKICMTPSLVAIIKEQCGVDCAEEFRASGYDWHIRPLTNAQMLKCAKVQVQYLLHAYDKFRNTLIDKNLLMDAYRECNEMSKRVWHPEKNKLDPSAHFSLYKRLCNKEMQGPWASRKLTEVQMEVFRVLHDWRYNTAQKHDKDMTTLLQDKALYDIAKALPENVDCIRKCLLPDTPCPLLEENLNHVCELIGNAVAESSGNPNADRKVSFYPGQKSSGVGGKRKTPKTGQNSEEKSAKVQEEEKYQVRLLRDYCVKSKIAAPEYSPVPGAGAKGKEGKMVTMNVVVGGVQYQPTQPSYTEKHAKAMAAIVALKELGLI